MGYANRVGFLVILISIFLSGLARFGATEEIQWKNPSAEQPVASGLPEAREPEALSGDLASAPSDDLTTRAISRQEEYCLVQLERIPTVEEKANLLASGLELQRYLGNNAYFARRVASKRSAPTLSRTMAQADGGFTTDILPEWKVHPDLLNGEIPEYARIPGELALEQDSQPNAPLYQENDAPTLSDPPTPGDSTTEDFLALYILFHEGVSLEEDAKAAVETLGGEVRDFIYSINGMVIWLPESQLPELLNENIVQWVEPPLPPMEETNDSNRIVTQVNDVQASPYGLDGSGVTVLVYDSGFVRDTHEDFGNRATARDASGLSDHATHVAGTVGGDGSRSGGTHRGMAPGVIIESYGFDYDGTDTFLYTNPGDIEVDYNDAINLYGAEVSNNSIGTNTARNGFSCSFTGDYGVTAMLIDSIVRGSLGTPMRIVWANGNERGTSRCGTSFNSTAPPAGAKNHITVGATNSNDESITSFTSWGPVDDGRLKPDITAPGCQSDDDRGVTSPGSSGGYRVKCGTSMASPTVCGIAALLLQEWKTLFAGEPLPRNSTLKILLAHTAADLGNPGPDYKFGYGGVRAKDAVDFLRRESLLENVLSQGEVAEVFVPVLAGTPELRATVAWDDPPGAPNTIPELVNDLDIVAISPSGQTYYPWTLDPANPADSAVRTQPDRINNIEQVWVAAPEEGVWTVRVTGFAVSEGPQDYSLAVTPDLITCSSTGIVDFKQNTYTCNSVVSITVIDCDLDVTDAPDTVTVTVTSGTDSETVVLTETADNSAALTGTLPLSLIDSPDTLHIAVGETIRVTYNDLDDGSGSPAVARGAAIIDCTPPNFAGLSKALPEDRRVDLSWAAASDGFPPILYAVYRAETSRGQDFSAAPLALVNGFSYTDEAVVNGTTYYYIVRARDAAGNEEPNTVELAARPVGPVARFLIDPVPSPQVVNSPFPITVRAADRDNNLVSDHADILSLVASENILADDTVEVLAMTNFADLSREYPNTIAAIETHFSDFNLTTFNSPTAGDLATALTGKDVFLIPEQERVSSVFDTAVSWAPVIFDFVQKGGVVIVCSRNRDEHEFLVQSNLLDISRIKTENPISLGEGVDHPLNEGVDYPFTFSYGTTYTDPPVGDVIARESGTNEAAVLANRVGAGWAVMIPSDFFERGSQLDRILANAVQLPTGFNLGINPSGLSMVNGVGSANVSVLSGSESARIFATSGSGISSSGSNTFEVFVNSRRGEVAFNATSYRCNSPIGVEVRDLDLAGLGTTTVPVYAITTGDVENVTLNETAVGVFVGTINSQAGNAVSGDGTLQTNSASDTISVKYDDANNGQGSPATPEDTAFIDCVDPIILDVGIAQLSINEATIKVRSSEPTKASVRLGAQCSSIIESFSSDVTNTTHSISLDNLASKTSYYFEVLVEDVAGNITIDDNVGRCYTFTTMSYPRLPFIEDFESGRFEDYWRVSGTGSFRSQVTDLNGPHEGSYHLTMDTSTNSSARNEVTLTIDLSDSSEGVVLSYYAREWGDESQTPPIPFVGGADFDGVAISDDGNEWYEIVGLRGLGSAYSKYSTSITAAAVEYGLDLHSEFKIRFNQFDNRPIDTDGIGIDLIEIVELPLPEKALSPNPADGATSQPYDLMLTWGDNEDATEYRISFGTTDPPNDIVEITETPMYDPGILSFNQVYYWRVDTINEAGIRVGDIWSFTVEPPPPPPAKPTNPSPADDAIDQPVNSLLLNWADGGGAREYDVYFSQEGFEPILLADKITTTVFTVEQVLDFATTYTWRIDATNLGGTTTGNVWSFLTVQPPSLEVTPGELSFRQGRDSITTQSITISNQASRGSGDLSYSVGLSGSAQSIDELGNNGGTNTGDWYLGGEFLAAEDSVIEEIEIYLDFTTPIPMDFVIYESDTLDGTYRNIFRFERSVTGTGQKFYSSGPISVPVREGKYYIIAAGWDTTARFYSTHPDISLPQPVGFGELLGGFYNSAFPLGDTVSRRGDDDLYYLRITSSRSWLFARDGSIPKDGELAPGESGTVIIGADSTDLDFETYLEQYSVRSNDPRQSEEGLLNSVSLVVVEKPDAAYNPLPPDADTSTPLNLSQLSWSANERAETFDVYFGEINPPPLVSMGQQSLSYLLTETFDPLQTYYWKVDTRNVDGLTTGEIWSFTTLPLPPGKATEPQPPNGTISESVKLNSVSWTNHPDAESVNIYFGTSNPPPLLAEGVTSHTQLIPTPLNFEAMYYWRVDSVNRGGTTTGDIWSFTTEPPPPPPGEPMNPFPQDGSVNVSLDIPRLTWQDAGGFSETYDVYLGADGEPLKLVASGLTLPSYTPNAFLEYDQYYFWQVASKNGFGTTFGEVWEFSTKPRPSLAISPDTMDFVLRPSEMDAQVLTLENLGDASSDAIDYSIFAVSSDGGTLRTTDSVGLQVSRGVAGNLYRGNEYLIDTSVALVEIQQTFNMTSPTDLEYVVLEALESDSIFRVIHRSEVMHAPAGLTDYSSGKLMVPLVQGRRYIIATGWQEPLEYYWQNSHEPDAVSFGTRTQSFAQSVYPLPNQVGSSPAFNTYQQKLITTDGWLSVSSGVMTTEGSIMPGSSHEVSVRADTYGLPKADFDGALVIDWGNEFLNTESITYPVTFSIDENEFPTVSNIFPPDASAIPAADIDVRITYSRRFFDLEKSDIMLSGSALLPNSDITIPIMLSSREWLFTIQNIQAGTLHLTMGTSDGLTLNDGPFAEWSYEVFSNHDFGDAPADIYPSSLADDGPRHAPSPLFMGANWDGEIDTIDGNNAEGDDLSQYDDDDGINISAPLPIGINSSVEMIASRAGVLDAWIDYNADGDWDDSGERIFSSKSIIAGINTLNIKPPAETVIGDNYARFRFSSAGVDSYTGEASDGEVEDYLLFTSLTAPTIEPEPDQTPDMQNSIVVQWVSGANEYYTEVAEDSSFAILQNTPVWSVVPQTEFTNLEIGKTYYYRVKARQNIPPNPPHESAWSNVVYSTQNQRPQLISTLPTIELKPGNAFNAEQVATIQDDNLAMLSVETHSTMGGATAGAFMQGEGLFLNLVVPCEITTGTHLVEVLVTDDANSTASLSVELEISSNTIPVLGEYSDLLFKAGSSRVVAPTQPPMDDVIGPWTVLVDPEDLPGGGTISVDNLSGEVQINTGGSTQSGIHTINVTVSDPCGNEVSNSFEINVLPGGSLFITK